MNTTKLGFKAFDAHELLCHFVAVKAGLYKSENLDMELFDLTFTPETEMPVDMFQASCGSGLAGALKGLGQKVIFVAVDKPMFWLYGNDQTRTMEELVNGRVATFPAQAPPHHMANMILGKSGIDIDNAVRLVPARDDVARFGLLKSNSVDAAVISSAIAPPKVLQSGFPMLCFFGDEVRIPTTGLAGHESHITKEKTLAGTLVHILGQSLDLIHRDAELVAGVLEEYFDVDKGLSTETALLYQGFFVKGGRTTDEIARGAIDAMSGSLGISSPPGIDEVYDLSLLQE